MTTIQCDICGKIMHEKEARVCPSVDMKFWLAERGECKEFYSFDLCMDCKPKVLLRVPDGLRDFLLKEMLFQ